MYPYFICFGQQISTYAIAAVVGILISGLYLCRRAKAFEENVDDTIVYALLCGIGVFVGAHLLFGIVNYEKIPNVFLQDSIKMTALAFFQAFGGMVFYGGLFGGLATGFIIARVKSVRFSRLADLFAPAIPLLHGICRIGCFLGGCCYGVESQFGLTYTNSLMPEANGIPRFPVQLLEAALCLILFFVLHLTGKPTQTEKHLLTKYLTGYALIRFFDEFLRGDPERGFWGPLSTSQWISLVVLAICIWTALQRTHVKMAKKY